jgi:L-fucose isomerase-like protein
MRRYIGPEIVPIPECECDDVIKSVNDNDVNELLNASKKRFDITGIHNIDTLRYTLRMYLGFNKIIEKYDLDGLNPRCHYDFSKDKKCTCCVPISMLSDEKIITGCEGDIMTSVTMMICYLLSDDIATYGDILNYDEENNWVMFSACGYAPFSMARNKTPVLRELEYEKWGFAGILSSNVLKKGRVTFGRLFEKTGSYGFVYGTGNGIDTNLRGKMFPALNVALDGTVENLIQKAPTQHFALVYGDHLQRLGYFIRMMNIEEICIS